MHMSVPAIHRRDAPCQHSPAQGGSQTLGFCKAPNVSPVSPWNRPCANKVEVDRYEGKIISMTLDRLQHRHRHLSCSILQGLVGPLLSTVCFHRSEHPWVECLNVNMLLLVADSAMKIQIGNCKRPECGWCLFCSFKELYRASLNSSSHTCVNTARLIISDCQLAVRRDNQSLKYIQRSWSFKSNLGFSISQKNTHAWRCRALQSQQRITTATTPTSEAQPPPRSRQASWWGKWLRPSVQDPWRSGKWPYGFLVCLEIVRNWAKIRRHYHYCV